MELREYIALRRKALGLTQTEIGRALGYSETAMSKIESGDSLPPISVLPAFADQLHLSLSDLLLMKENPAPFTGSNLPYNWQIVSTNLRAVRLGHHLKQREAAEKIGVDKRTLITYEKGDACPNWVTLSRILSFCPGDPAELFYGRLYPEIQASPLFRKRGTLPFFVFFFGVLVGAGILGSIWAPLALWPRESSSSSSAPFNHSTWSGGSSSSPFSSTSASSSTPVEGLTELVVIGPTGAAWEVPMLFPALGQTSTLQIGIYTNWDFPGNARRNIEYRFALDPSRPNGVTLSRQASDGTTLGENDWASVDNATITAYNDPANPMSSSPYPSFEVYVWARSSSSSNPEPPTMEGIPLTIQMTENGTYHD